RAPPTRRRSVRRRGSFRPSPLPHQLDLGNEPHVETPRDLLLHERHERAHVARGRAVRVHDEVRVLLAHYRAPDGAALQARGLDESPGEIARWIAKDRPG